MISSEHTFTMLITSVGEKSSSVFSTDVVEKTLKTRTGSLRNESELSKSES